MVRIVLLFSMLLYNCFAAMSQSNTPKYSNEFLQLGAGARSFGMGYSMSSHTSDATSGYWNPAGLMQLPEKYQLSLMHSAYFAGLANYDFGSFAVKNDSTSALSVSVIRFAVDDIADTRLLIDANGAVNYDNVQFFSAADYAFLISYARNLQFLESQIGTTVKVIRRTVGDFASSWGFGLDMGWQKRTDTWNFGISAKDIFSTFNVWSYNYELLATTYTATGNELPEDNLEITLPRLIPSVSRYFSITPKLSLLASIDLVTTFDGKRNTLIKTNVLSIDPALGMELGFKNMIFLRAGLGQFQQIEDFEQNLDWTFQPNLGLGFKFNELSIDYAFTDIGDQAAGLYSHVFSINVDFKSGDE
ncbi:MAG: hypothetical protein ACJA0X_001129 [Cyclobacteriaceae bacterium]|jgi:hypothetical protein